MKMKSLQEFSMLVRTCFLQSKGFLLIRVLSCILLCLAMCWSSATRNHLVSCSDVIQGSLDYDICHSCTDNNANFQDFLFPVGEIKKDLNQGSSSSRCSALQNICSNANFFCFPSTLSGFLAGESDCKQATCRVPEYLDDFMSAEVQDYHNIWKAESSCFTVHATYKFLNGRTISCSLNSLKDFQDKLSSQNTIVDYISCKGHTIPNNSMHWSASIPERNSIVVKSDALDSSSSLHVAINPPLLDWGQRNLYVPSLAFLSVTNTCNDSILHIYEPFSTNPQFYSYGFQGVSLEPGESASLSFVFLPRWLGLSSAHLVLQTSSGGFLILAKGIGIDSPYHIQALIGMDGPSNVRLMNGFSLYNPFDTALYVEEVKGWLAVTTSNTSETAEVFCMADALHSSDDSNFILDDKEWLNVKGREHGLPIIGLRPSSQWQIDPGRTEPILEMNLLPHVEGTIFGSFCMQLQSSSVNRTDTIVVPLEADIHGRVAYQSLTGSVSVFLDFVIAYDERGSLASTLSLRNSASYLLSVIKISEIKDSVKLFQVKYIKGLLLYPGSLTSIAVVIYTPPNASHNPRPDFPSLSSECKLLIVTNDSVSPEVEISCIDVVHSYFGHKPGSASTPAPKRSITRFDFQQGRENSKNLEMGSSGSIFQVPSSFKWKVSEIAEIDELILRNWKSQGITSNTSVLDDNVLLFPTVEMGSYHSKWITVSNPSAKPVLMQLVLNSGAIIDECKASGKSPQHSFFNSLVQDESIRHGFSMEETAVTEACVRPYGKALFGPIIFSPSNRCVWRSSALIRNNLTGVEWLTLQGLVGFVSLAVLEGSEPIKNLEFNVDLPFLLNVSTPELPSHTEIAKAACSQPLSKVLYAKNVGDMPLEVRRIEVSGTKCGSDGFMILTCKGFSLEPGESKKLLISYQTDFSASVVHKDLELALATGVIVIPMRASLPFYMLSLCRKSFFWTLIRKLSVVVLLAALVTFILFCRIVPRSVAFTGQDYLFKSEQKSIATISRVGKSSRAHRNQKNSRLLRGYENTETAFDDRYLDSLNSVEEVAVSAQPLQHMSKNEDQVIAGLHVQDSTTLSSSPMVKTVDEVECSLAPETPRTSNLTVRIQKERGRRRKRRASGACSGLTGKLDVSSSQSGNSTPSSPLSPVLPFAPKRSWPLSPDYENSVRAPKHLVEREQSKSCQKERAFQAVTEAKLPEQDISMKSLDDSCLLTVHRQPSIPQQAASRPVLLPSATFPSAGWRAPGPQGNSSFLTLPATIAPHARAPGSKFKEEPTRIEEKSCLREEFTYDIWGNHFSEYHLVNSHNSRPIVSDASDGESQSFFARGPQSLAQELTEKSVSPTPTFGRPVSSATALSADSVNCLHRVCN